jgi:hypothetical protein
VAGCWRRLHNEELQNLYALQNIIRVIKSRRMRWIGLVARMGMRTATVFLLENLKGIYHSENPGVDGKVILEWEFVDWTHLAQDRD